MKERRTALLVVGGFAAAALLLAALLGESVREALAGPVLAVAARVDILLRAVPQAALWAIFVALAGLGAMGSLLRGVKLAAPPADAEPQRRGRVAELARWVQQTGEGRYFRRRLLQQMLGLTLAARGRDPQPDLPTLQRIVQTNELDLPPDAHAYLADGLSAVTYRDLESMSQRGDAFWLRLRRLLLRGRLTAPPDPGLERLVAYLEHVMEIPDDRPDPR